MQMSTPLVEVDCRIMCDNLTNESSLEWIERHANVTVEPKQLDYIDDSMKGRDCIVLNKVCHLTTYYIRWSTYLTIFQLLHRQTDMVAYIESVKQLLRADGFILLIEQTSDFEVAFACEALTFANGQLPVYDGSRSYG